MGGGRGRKRDHAEYSRDDPPNDMGIGATLAHLRGGTVQSPAPKKDGDSDSGEWTVVTSRKKKKQKVTNHPELSYSELHKMQSSIKLGDLQSLVLYCLGDATSPHWISLRHHNMVQKAVVLFIPGLELGMFGGDVPMVVAQGKSAQIEQQAAQNDGSSETSPNDGAHGAEQNNPRSTVHETYDSPGQSGTSPDDYLPLQMKAESLPEPLKPLAGIFSHVWPVKAPGDDRRVHSPLQAILQSPITKTQEEKRLEKEMKGPKPVAGGKNYENKRTPVTEYITSNEDLEENKYVLHPANYTTKERVNAYQRRVRNRQGSNDGWVDTRVANFDDGIVPEKDIEEGSLLRARKILAMDCEMCTVEGGAQALTRISLVDWDGSTIMDELVKPHLPIIDYLTPYSGMTAEKLDPITTTLHDIQKRLLTILTPQTILVGHSLNSDLSAIKLTHPFIIDTALLYPHARGPPLKCALKWLAQKYLFREIQKGHGKNGHDSIEDALACLDLVKLKCEKGPAWGTSEATNESIFKRLKRTPVPGAKGGGDATGRTGAIIDHGNAERNFGMMGSYVISSNTDAEIVAGVERAVHGDKDGKHIPGGGVDFTWARMRELEMLRGWRNDDPANTPPPPDPKPDALAAAVAQTVAHVKTVKEFLPPFTLLIIYSGTGDPREMARLQGMQKRARLEYQTKKWDEMSVKWTDVEEQALRRACTKARKGLALVCVT